MTSHPSRDPWRKLDTIDSHVKDFGHRNPRLRLPKKFLIIEATFVEIVKEELAFFIGLPIIQELTNFTSLVEVKKSSAVNYVDA